MTELQKKIAAKAEQALFQTGFETNPGFCWRWVRQVLEATMGEEAPIPPRGVDAGGALDWYIEEGMKRERVTNTLPGDIYFWTGPGHGRHGHVGIRIYGNQLAENSSVHASGSDREARGTRALWVLPSISAVVRVKPVRRAKVG